MRQENRKDQEASEGLDSTKVDAPNSRIQGEVQIPNADVQGAVDVPTGVDPYVTKRNRASGSSLKQDKVADVLKAAPSGAIPATGESRSIKFSGDDEIIAGALSSTPIVSQGTRSDSRFNRKLDVYTKGIDYNPSEQFIREEDGVKSLSEQKDAVQGYRGTIRNNLTLNQKNNGAVPGSINFERSLDQIGYDLFTFSRGQIIKGGSTVTGPYYDVPNFTPITSNFAGFDGCELYDSKGIKLGNQGDGIFESLTIGEAIGNRYYVKTGLIRSNYWNKALHVSINNEGKIDKFYFDVIDCTVNKDGDLPDRVINRSATHALTHVNRCELVRQNIDAEAGDEVTSKYWSPLPRAISEPSATICYLNDMEAMGNHIFVAYKAAATAQCKALNDGAKNGIHPSRSLKEYLLGDIIPEVSSSIYHDIDDPFALEWVLQGAASTAIIMNDSTSKYKTIGNALTMPLSITSYIQTADNSMDVFHVDKEFAAMLNANVAFSTIDHEYDPLSPVLFTEKVVVIDPFDWNKLFSFKSIDTFGNPILESQPVSYTYSDVRNNYTVVADCWFLKGIYEFLKSKLPRLIRVKGDGTIKSLKGQELIIPIRYSFDHPSLWQTIVLGATKFMVYERTNSMVDILRIEENYGYPFSDLTTIAKANPLNNVNYEIQSLKQPLKIKTMLPSAAIRVVWPELFTSLKEDTNKWWTMLPWYFNEAEFYNETDASQSSIKGYFSGKCAMSYPTIASGVRSAYADMIYSMTERDVRLCLDRITYIPNNSNAPVLSYKYDLSSDGIPTIPFGKGGIDFTLNKFLSLPRELGWSFISPAGLITPIIVGETDLKESVTTNLSKLELQVTKDKFYYQEFNNNRVFGGFRLKYYFASGKSPLGKNILDPVDMNVARGTNFAQDYNYICSTPLYVGFAVQDPGFRLGLGEMFDAGKISNQTAKFSPFTIPLISGDNVPYKAKIEITSLQKGLWARVQRLPFAISPWDGAVMSENLGQDDGTAYDLFDFMYMFGLKGFRASDYEEDLYNKENAIISMGLTYINDPFVEDSPLMKDAKAYTNL